MKRSMIINGGFLVAIKVIPQLRRYHLFFVLFLICAYNTKLAQAVNDESLEEFGDVMQFALPAIGLGATAFYKDKEGAKQWAYSGLTSVGTTTVLKSVYQKIRPNASTSATSFPSGHTTAVFWGASFLDQRYGKWWGIPAYTAAGITAYSRVISDNHHIDDTIMGASIALMSSWYWVTPHEGAVSLIPFQQNDAYGVSFHINEGGKHGDYSGLNDNDRWRYSITFGPATQQKNEVTSPAGTGTTFDLEDFRETNDPTTTANAVIERFMGRHLTLFSVEPFEARDFGQFSQPTVFNNTTFLPGEEIRSAYRLTDFRLQYYYDLLPASKIILKVGAGLSYQHTTVEMATTDDTKIDKTTSDIWLPLVNASLGYQFNPRLSVSADLTGLSLGGQKQLDASVSLGYRLDKYWDAGFGFGIYDHETESDELKSAVKYNVLMTYIGYSFY
jgi:membrane-associated phospholipid phosphatase